MLTATCGVLIALFVAAENDSQWLTVSPTPTREQAIVILAPTAVHPGHSYLLTWDMRVEGEKAWRFRAEFAGVTVRFTGADEYASTSLEKQTSCWQTLDWQRAWLVVDPSPGTHTIDASMAIVSKEQLPGRFRVRNVQLFNLDEPISLAPNQGELQFSVVDTSGKNTPARVYILDEDGNGITPTYTYSYTQGTRCFELIDPRLAHIALPAGVYTVRAMKGFDNAIATETATVEPGQRTRVTLTIRPQIVGFDQFRYCAVDHHTHLYRHGGSLYPMMDLHEVLGIAQAEGVTSLPFQGVDKAFERNEGLVGDTCSIFYTQELTRDFWGHICPIYHRATFSGVGPDKNPRPIQEVGSAWPMNMEYISGINTFGNGAVTYAHPYGPLRPGSEFDSLADPKSGLIAREWPIDLALGVPCSIDMLTKEDARGDFDLKFRDYMRALNLGFRCGVTGSTDFHLDQGREPIGGLRTYVLGGGGMNWPGPALNYAAGKTFATNGPLIELDVAGFSPGMTFKSDCPPVTQMNLRAESLWGITKARIWVNGELYHEIPSVNGVIRADTANYPEFGITMYRSGWMLVTVEGPPAPDVMSSPEGKPCVPGQFAMTSPIYFEIEDRPAPADPVAALYFAEWCEAVRRGFEKLCAEQAIALPENLRTSVHDRIDKAWTIFMDKALADTLGGDDLPPPRG